MDSNTISIVIHYISIILGAFIGTMVSGFLVTIGKPHWGKLNPKGDFIGLWRLFGYFVFEVLVIAFVFEWGSPLIDTYLHIYLDYIIGISSAVFGIFFIWFVYTLDYDIKTQYKWAFPTICFTIAFLNLILTYY